MTPAQFKSIRQRLGFSIEEWATELGMTGERSNARSRIDDYESGRRAVPPSVARLVAVYDAAGEVLDFIEDANGQTVCINRITVDAV